MAELQVTSSQLRASAEEIRHLGQEINSSLENLRETEGALAGMWEGEAQTTFRTAFNTSATQMETYKSAIENYAQTLE